MMTAMQTQLLHLVRDTARVNEGPEARKAVAFFFVEALAEIRTQLRVLTGQEVELHFQGQTCTYPLFGRTVNVHNAVRQIMFVKGNSELGLTEGFQAFVHRVETAKEVDLEGLAVRESHTLRRQMREGHWQQVLHHAFFGERTLN